jgi:chaperone modulatory protein CbpM
MTRELADSLWLDESCVCGIEHLAELSGLSVEEIVDLVDAGVLTPDDGGEAPPSFQLSAILVVKTARRLRDDFQLDRNGIALALALLRRIGELEQQIDARSAAAPGLRR